MVDKETEGRDGALGRRYSKNKDREEEIVRCLGVNLCFCILLENRVEERGVGYEGLRGIGV